MHPKSCHLHRDVIVIINAFITTDPAFFLFLFKIMANEKKKKKKSFPY